MEITATELKLNLSKYLDAANNEPIVITKNGKAIAQLTGMRTFKYDLSELEQWIKQTASASVLGEGAETYGASTTNPGGTDDTCASKEGWMLTLNGEPVAQLTPILKQRKKRRLGFMDCPPASEETIAALFESEWTDDDYEQWVNNY